MEFLAVLILGLKISEECNNNFVEFLGDEALLFLEFPGAKNFTALGSTVSSLEPLQGGSLLFNTKFPEILGTQFIDLYLLSQSCSHPVFLIM